MTVMQQALLKAKLITDADIKKADKQAGKLCPKCKARMYKIDDKWSCSSCKRTS